MHCLRKKAKHELLGRVKAKQSFKRRGFLDLEEAATVIISKSEAGGYTHGINGCGY